MSRNSESRSFNSLTSDQLHHFRPGIPVEVTSDEEGNIGSWYSAKIVKRIDSSRFRVQYTNLVDNKNGEKLMEEIVDADFIRPAAPREKGRKFRLEEKVDAFCLDGWWEGKISEELGNGRFLVYFVTTKELIEFGEEELRLHRDWIDGSWVPPLEKNNISNNAQNGKQKYEQKFENGMRVEVSCDEEEDLEGAWLTAKIIDSQRNRYMVEYDRLRTPDGKELLKEVVNAALIRPQPPKLPIRPFKVSEKVDVFRGCGWLEGTVSRALSETDYMVYLPDTLKEEKVKVSELRLHQDWIDGKWVMSNVVRASALPRFEPEAVLACKVRMEEGDIVTMWRIQWKGYSVEEATWERRDEILKVFPEFNPN